MSTTDSRATQNGTPPRDTASPPPQDGDAATTEKLAPTTTLPKAAAANDAGDTTDAGKINAPEHATKDSRFDGPINRSLFDSAGPALRYRPAEPEETSGILAATTGGGGDHAPARDQPAAGDPPPSVSPDADRKPAASAGEPAPPAPATRATPPPATDAPASNTDGDAPALFPTAPVSAALDDDSSAAAATTENFFFEDGMRRQRRDMLLHLCVAGDEVLALTSPAGNGKTTFIQYLTRHAAEGQVTGVIRVKPRMPWHELVSVIHAALLGSAASDPGEAPAALAGVRQHLQNNYRKALPPLLIFDDAQTLTPELLSVLREMICLQDPVDALGANLIFVGDETVATNLTGVFPKQRVNVLDLPRLTDLNARRYILARLLAAGIRDPEATLGQRRLRKMVRLSRGLPAQLEIQIGRRMHKHPQFRHLQPGIDARRALSLLLATALLAGAGGGAYFYRERINDLLGENVAHLSHVMNLLTSTLMPDREPAAGQSDAAATEQTAPQAATDSPYTDESLFVQPADGQAPAETAGSDVASAQRQLLWVTLQDPNHYTLQLLGTTDEGAAAHVISEYKMQGEAFYFASHINDQPWYNVIYGSYADEQSARQQIENLPPALRTNVQVRTFRDMQSLVIAK